MTHADHGHHGTAATGSTTYFSATEWQAFQAEDRAAAGIVTGLMASIFSIGLVLYFIVDLVIGF